MGRVTGSEIGSFKHEKDFAVMCSEDSDWIEMILCRSQFRTPMRLQIRRPRFDSRQYQIFLKKKTVVGLERGPLSLVSTTEELLGRNSSGSCLENREYGWRDPSR
jgi:hypothetical protein